MEKCIYTTTSPAYVACRWADTKEGRAAIKVQLQRFLLGTL